MIAYVRKPLVVLSLIVTAILVAVASTPLPRAAEGDPPAAERPAKRRGRLPAYYARVVTPEQREEIYSIQEEYAPEIEDLLAQLQVKIAERDAKVKGVLLPDQLKQVEEFRAAARERRLSGESPDEPAEGDGDPGETNE